MWRQVSLIILKQCRESKRGFAPLFISIPISFEGEGDKGGEVEKAQVGVEDIL